MFTNDDRTMLTSDDFKRKESEMRFYIDNTEGDYIGFRMDGKAFHTFTKGFKRPYDTDLMIMMNAGAMEVVHSVFNRALFAYVQSDEISVVVPSKTSIDGDTGIFSNRLEKILSVASSAVTAGFVAEMAKMGYFDDMKSLPKFDARAFMLKDIDEVNDYLQWRRLDARKNAITMAVQMIRTYRELKGVSTRERAEMLKGTEYEVLPEEFMNGRIISRFTVPEEVTFFDKRVNEEKTVTFNRSHWVIKEATREVADAVINQYR